MPIKIEDKTVQKIMVGDKEVLKVVFGTNDGVGDIKYQKSITPITWTSVALYGPIDASQTFVDGAVSCVVDSKSPYSYRLRIYTSEALASSPFTSSDTLSNILLKWYNYENSTNYTQIRNITIAPMIYNRDTSNHTYSNIKVRVSTDSAMSTYTEYTATNTLTLSAGTYNLVPGVTINPDSFISYSFLRYFYSPYFSIRARINSWGVPGYLDVAGGFAFEFEVA